MNKYVKHIGLGVLGLGVGTAILLEILPLDQHPLITFLIVSCMYIIAHSNVISLLNAEDKE